MRGSLPCLALVTLLALQASIAGWSQFPLQVVVWLCILSLCLLVFSHSFWLKNTSFLPDFGQDDLSQVKVGPQQGVTGGSG